MPNIRPRIVRAVAHYVELTEDEKRFLIQHDRPDLVRMANYANTDRNWTEQILNVINEFLTNNGFNQGSG